MINFKTFFEQTEPLGLIEDIDIDGVGTVSAKVDSGNGAYNVLHGVNFKTNKNSITFETVGDKLITKPVLELIDINIGSGNIEKRPVVLFNVTINGKQFKDVKFSLSDRSQNEEKALLGKDFIVALGGLIDVRK